MIPPSLSKQIVLLPKLPNTSFSEQCIFVASFPSPPPFTSQNPAASLASRTIRFPPSQRKHFSQPLPSPTVSSPISPCTSFSLVPSTTPNPQSPIPISHLISSQPTSSHPIPSHLISPHLTSPNQTQIQTYHHRQQNPSFFTKRIKLLPVHPPRRKIQILLSGGKK